MKRLFCGNTFRMVTCNRSTDTPGCKTKALGTGRCLGFVCMLFNLNLVKKNV